MGRRGKGKRRKPQRRSVGRPVARLGGLPPRRKPRMSDARVIYLNRANYEARVAREGIKPEYLREVVWPEFDSSRALRECLEKWSAWLTDIVAELDTPSDELDSWDLVDVHRERETACALLDAAVEAITASSPWEAVDKLEIQLHNQAANCELSDGEKMLYADALRRFPDKTEVKAYLSEEPRVRLTCRGKVTFADRLDAALVVAGAQRPRKKVNDNRAEKRCYYCLVCRGWHATSQPRTWPLRVKWERPRAGKQGSQCECVDTEAAAS